MLSQTENKLRSFVDKLTASLTERTNIRVVPADAWAATPSTDPPMLLYRVADVAVIGDRILAVTGHEIAHLLWTTEYKYTFDVSRKPKAAHQLLNVVEDARIERLFAERYPGAQSLFAELHGDGDDNSESAYPKSMREKFPELPIKWRYIFNIDRLLHGNDLLGSDDDKQAVMDVAESLHRAADAPTTQECADELEPAYKKMLELFIKGAEELKKRRKEKQDLQDALDKATDDAIKRLMRQDMVNTGAFDDDQDEDVAEELEHQAAEQDDGKPGGEDGSPGMREGGVGEATEGGSPGDEDAEGDGDAAFDPDAQANPSGSGHASEDAKGSIGGVGNVAGEGDTGVDEYGETEELSDADRVRPVNIYEEMLAEEQDSGNSAIRSLQQHQRERAKAAKHVENLIKEEREEASRELGDVFGIDEGQSVTAGLREQLERQGQVYAQDAAKLSREIRTLRGYARSVLQDNARERYAGSYDRGRHIKKTRLYRPILDDFRVFERREQVGGKSYSIAVVVDQSGSMHSYSHQAMSKQMLAYEASLVFLEAFDKLASTCLIGFTDFPKQSNARRVSRYRYRHRAGYMQSRTYKGTGQTLDSRKFTVPMLRESVGSTPMGEGLAAGIANLRSEQTEVRAILLVTDGYPSDGSRAKTEAQRARRLGIDIYSLLISDYIGADDAATQFLSEISVRVKAIASSSDIPEQVYQLLRGIVKRGGYGAPA